MEIIQAELNATPERDEIIQFIENSQRGIMKGYFQNCLLYTSDAADED